MPREEREREDRDAAMEFSTGETVVRDAISFCRPDFDVKINTFQEIRIIFLNKKKIK